MANDAPLRRDPSGQAALGITNETLDLLYAAYGDPDSGSLHVTMHNWDTTELEWIKWDGRIDTIVSGDLIVAVDDLEDLTTTGNAVLVTIDQALDDQRLNYLYSGTLEDSGNTYVGYEDKAGVYYITKYDSSGDPTYTKGAGGIPDKSTASNWTGLSYGSVMATF